MLRYQARPPHVRIILSTVQLKQQLFERIKILYPEKVLDDREIGEILQSIIGAVITPIIDNQVPQNAYEQSSLDLIEFYLPNSRDTHNASYDIFVGLETWIVRLVLSSVPQLLVEGSFIVNGFSLTTPDALILDVTINDVSTRRIETPAALDYGSLKWDNLELARF